MRNVARAGRELATPVASAVLAWVFNKHAMVEVPASTDAAACMCPQRVMAHARDAGGARNNPVAGML